MENTMGMVQSKYAGFWIRLVAMLIDGLIIGVLVGVLSFSKQGYMISWLIYIAYTIGFWIYKSATPGKMILGLKITDEQGKNLTWQTAVLRYVGYFVSSLVFGIGYIWAAFDPKKQGWHDKIAKTFVVKR